VIANKINKDLNFPSAPSAAGHMTTKKGRTSRHRGVCWDKKGKKWVVESRQRTHAAQQRWARHQSIESY
jgi:hypothetical protein